MCKRTSCLQKQNSGKAQSSLDADLQSYMTSCIYPKTLTTGEYFSASFLNQERIKRKRATPPYRTYSHRNPS